MAISKCPESALLVYWASGKLTSSEKVSVDEHLLSCQSCCASIAALGYDQKLELAPVVREDQSRTVQVPDTHLAPGVARMTAVIHQGPKVGTTLGRYLILSELGAGGMGQVFAAFDPELDRKVAIKLIRSNPGPYEADLTARLQREAQAMARLNHPNVVSVFDVGIHQGQVFVAMEFIAGVSLTAWLKEQVRSPDEVLKVFIEAGRGLAAAHAVGLVHRDFKPDNVLVGNDGTVRVVDFGLARPMMTSTSGPQNPAAGSGPEARTPFEAPLTVDGVLMGTPAYMAPEQHIMASVGPLADQFSFGVALFEALYGARPFSSAEVRAYGKRETTSLTPVFPFGSEKRVPAVIRRALLKAIAAEPDRRFATIQALLKAITREPLIHPKKVFAMVAALGVCAAVVTTVRYAVSTEERACRTELPRLTALWNATTQKSLQSAFLKTGKVFAEDAWAATEKVLGSFVNDWKNARAEACLATKVRGEQSSTLLDLRTACLDRRLDELEALLEVFQNADSHVVEYASLAAQSLNPIARCGDTAELLQPMPLPDSLPARTKVASLRSELGKSKVLADTGSVAEALAWANNLESAAREVDYPPVLAEVLLSQGELRRKVGDLKVAEGILYEASWTALRSHDLRVNAQALTALSLDLVEQGRADESLRWGQFANAAITGLGGDDALQGHLHHVLGLAFEQKGDRTSSLTHLGKCLSLREKQFGVDSLLVATTRTAFGRELQAAGKVDEAIAHQQKALEAMERIHGASHPNLLVPLDALASTYSAVRNREEALALRKRAAEISEKSLGTLDVRTAKTQEEYAAELTRAGKNPEALSWQQQALGSYFSSVGAKHPDTAAAHLSLGDLLVKASQYSVALDQYELGLRAAQKAYGNDAARLAPFLARLGSAQAELKKPELAEETLSLAIERYEQGGTSGEGLARTRFLLAKVLYQNPRERTHAAAVAQKAMETFTDAGLSQDAAEVRAWIAQTSRTARRPRR